MAARKKAKRSVEDRLTHLENIQRRFLDAHGETYPGATDDRAELGAGDDSDNDDDDED
jgi:hypothetical protein